MPQRFITIKNRSFKIFKCNRYLESFIFNVFWPSYHKLMQNSTFSQIFFFNKAFLFYVSSTILFLLMQLCLLLSKTSYTYNLKIKFQIYYYRNISSYISKFYYN